MHCRPFTAPWAGKSSLGTKIYPKKAGIRALVSLKKIIFKEEQNFWSLWAEHLPVISFLDIVNNSVVSSTFLGLFPPGYHFIFLSEKKWSNWEKDIFLLFHFLQLSNRFSFLLKRKNPQRQRLSSVLLRSVSTCASSRDVTPASLTKNAKFGSGGTLQTSNEDGEERKINSPAHGAKRVI